MAKREVLSFPDERLRTVAQPVEEINEQIRQIVADMLETMYAQEGIGLAATQVNIHQRITVIDISETRDQPLVFINPEIIAQSGTTGIEEGCLSVPDYTAWVPRAENVTVRALNLSGETFELQADGLLAICLQHELDHLQGKLFVDYLSPLKRERLLKRIEKRARQERTT